MPRAPRLTPDERRGALIEATIPLLLQHGASVSTRQIAETAGVAEGTIFRVFDSKEDLVHAAATQLLASDGLITPLAGIPSDADLPTTVLHIARRLSERVSDVHAMIAILHEGRGRRGPVPHLEPRPQPPAPPEASSTCERPDPRAIQARVIEAVTAALTPHADALRTTPRVAAATLVALVSGSHHGGTPTDFDTHAIADVLLHGVASARPSQGAS